MNGDVDNSKGRKSKIITGTRKKCGSRKFATNKFDARVSEETRTTQGNPNTVTLWSTNIAHYTFFYGKLFQ